MSRQQAQMLKVASPISGIVVTPRVHDLVGSYAPAGTLIAEVANTSMMRARVYVSEPEFRKLQIISGNSLRMDSLWAPTTGTVVSISPTAQPVEPGLMATPKYEGMRLPSFFAVDILVANADGRLHDGMTGTAKIYGARKAMLKSMLQPVVAAIARRLW